MNTTDSPTTRPARWWTVPTAAALLALSVLAAGWFGVSWALAAHDSSVELAATRDRVLRAGRQAVINYNSIDHNRARQDMDRALRGTTGPLRDVLENSREQRVGQITEKKAVMRAKVLDSALTELNVRAGKARMIAGYTITRTVDGGKPSTSRWRVRVELTRTDQKWKMSRMTPTAL
ncbi:hypothetical protein [Actinopolyspora mortivallis]|uniref:Mce-associated membrane protein n=1 Tax=Actinopolyspora mortivallis TaxID=33906 RepID=A0A2T0GSD9_ACTMO|nr:hypothetical protein [Actinopolyspora mortivallis]PRW62019.1 hypothetical protein CEP50_17650 [Actinopolyspora mortivallis]